MSPKVSSEKAKKTLLFFLPPAFGMLVVLLVFYPGYMT